ncbi:QcrA and Rieske domain-containing protein [Spirosoma radiotolerans]|uniref:(2Fe-2S)-binding protein n=1 Tax=Spirosoma radiotolerans TaxID=1379870 RepID=A0A0E3ZSR8_9BACT|nr:Rieske (2Fe-2S) protein [Spirosoma radiotolerans]AKD53650.1 (2Fe-2S)-binding protein [Spirosoma radiotolerans]
MKSNPTTDQMKRGEFLRSLGMSSAALMAFYCMGTTLTSCSKSNDDPAPATPGTGTGTTTGTGLTGNADSAKGAINYTLDLTDTNYSKLKTAGQYAIVGSTLVAKVKGGNFIALSKVCTHEGTTVQYRSDSDDIYCSNHGSEFTTTGAVKVGPAAKALTQYKTALSTDGNSLTVTA